MRKFSFILSLIMLVSCLCLSAFAVENTDTVSWENLSDATGGGYPRSAA